MKVSAQYAEEHIADLLILAGDGEEVEIAAPDRPTLKLIVSQPLAPAIRSGRRILGAGRGEMRVPSEEEWDEMDRELEQQMVHAPLMSSGEI